MSKFLLQEVSPDHHKKCQDDCKKLSGPMLKCMNLSSIGKKPCQNVIHVECAGYDPSIVLHFTSYFCVDCTTSDESLHQQMSEIETKAKLAVKNTEKMSKISVSLDEYEKLQKVAEKLEEQLREKIQLVSQQASEQEKLAVTIQSQQKSIEKQNLQIQQLSDTIQRMKHENISSAPAAAGSVLASTFIDRLNDTLLQAEGIDEKLRRKHQIPSNIETNHASAAGISNVTFNVSNSHTGWPDYEEQQRAASAQDEHSLLLVRASLAKPVPFDGDVTKWATFISEFVRTSYRGHYRDFEDMDRLRELITGEAREMFTTELSDPCAEALPTLMRLDEFFGVKGNAVRVALDRITQLPKMEKSNDKKRLTILYTHAKQFALQCRIHKQEQELTSESILYILETRMHADYVKAWRPWTKTNNKSENVDGVIAYLEDTIRDLNFRSTKVKPAVTANVNAITEATGGPENGGTETSSTQQSSSFKTQDKSRKKGKKKNRYANCECFECKEKHPFYKCPQFIAANNAKRLEIVNRLHVCIRCLCSNRHKVEECHNKCLRCFISGCTVKNKHPLMHGHTNDQIPSFTSFNGHVDVRSLRTTSHFAMVPGDVIASDGTHIPITIMYDGGSGLSLATSWLFDQAKCESQLDYELTLRWATDVTHTDSNAKLCDIKFLPQGRSKPIVIKNVTAVKDLNLPEQDQDPDYFKRQYPHLANVPLPAYPRQTPQILLGLSHAGLMSQLTSITSGKAEDPVAALSPLGWVVYGNCPDSLRCRAIQQPTWVNLTRNDNSAQEISNEELLKYIRSCNDVESIGIAHKEASLLSEDDQKAEKIIKSTMKFNEIDKRYEIGLLWKTESGSMPDNYNEALQRLISTEKRLEKLNMMQFAKDQFKEQIKNGWLVETSREEADKHPRRYFVYGFLTFNKNKNPPKPRWVNDTAAKHNGVSLNSMLLKGPDSLVPLPQSMCVLREGQIAYQGDVRSMFNQVLLPYEDQFSQLTMWRDGDTSVPPKIYRQTRVIFGPTCSPSITSAVRIHHANQCKDEFPEAADVAINQMYVDDAPDSRDTVEEAAKVANNLIEMFARIGWPLIQFQSNSQEFLKKLPQDHVNTQITEIGNDDEEFITKVLGIFWKPLQDVYVYRLNDDSIIQKCTKQGYQPTKREMLSTVMRIFDPLGQIAPFRIRGHMIMQHVWRAGTDWKKKPPKEICDEFTKWLSDFAIVAKLEIPRAYSSLPLKDCELSLHVFVDAGTEAYAACVYIHIKYNDRIFVRLIASKARVAPLKYMSIPRLELMSGLLGARLLRSVMSWHRRLNFIEYTCWTDSDVSFKWIRSHHLPRTAFSAPRIAEIQELTSADKWRYVPSKLNVADYATKERQMDYSDHNHEWFTGPKFLYESIDKWPQQPTKKSNEVSIEANVAVIQSSNQAEDSHHEVLTEISSFWRSNWTIFTRIIAIALRYADEFLPEHPQRRKRGRITRYEQMRAEDFIIRQVQKSVFAEEYKSLSKGNKIKKSSPLYTLSPFMCPDTKLIRATTRLSNRFPLNMRSPPILPNFHEVTDTIVRYYHKLNLHVGDAAIIAQIRSRVWIINAKRAVRRCRARCLYCIEDRTKPATTIRANLPDFRLDINAKPFFHTGCDLFGPFTVYTGRSKNKKDVHIVIFTCMVTRAVYFEVLDDKSTATFLVAFDKLWARRGPISQMYSDNGLNFVGAENVINADEIQQKTEDRRITWHFNPPYTPQFGGAWERLIKDVKRALYASLGSFIVPRLSMESALAKIEANLNNRPLTELPVSSVEDIPITPQLLMSGYPNYPAMNEDFEGTITEQSDIMKIQAAKRINALVQTFRHRFITEYAPIITRRSVNKENDKYAIKLHDYVIYLDPTKNPADWSRGLVCKTYPGEDNKVRVADIKLKDGTILERRPSHLIAKLDIRLEEEEAESSKYSKYCNLLANQNSNSFKLPNSPNLPNSPSREINKESINKNKMSKHVNCRVFDDSTKVEPEELERNQNIVLTNRQRLHYIDRSRKNFLFVKNFPPNLGAAEVYSIMAEFGDINLIASSSWNGVQPFSCIIGFSDPASVSSALLMNESQIVTVNNIAYKQKFECLRKPFIPHKSIHKPIYAFLDITLPLDVSQRILFITPSETNELLTRSTMPAIAHTGGFINYCPRTHRYEFEQMPVDISNGAKAVRQLPFVPKAREAVVSSTHSNNINRTRSSRQSSSNSERNSLYAIRHTMSDLHSSTSSNSRSISTSSGHIRVQIDNDTPDDFEDYGTASQVDLRQIIDKREDIKRIKSIISRPKRPAKQQRL